MDKIAKLPLKSQENSTYT